MMCPFLFLDGWEMSKNAEDLVDWFCWFVADVLQNLVLFKLEWSALCE